MNELSWLLYIADVLPRFGNGLQSVSIFLMFCLVLTTIGLFVCFIDAEVENKKFIKSMFMSSLFSFVFFLFLALSTALIPSRETILLIAGSQVGEVVINTPEAQAIINDIHEVIKAQLESLKE